MNADKRRYGWGLLFVMATICHAQRADKGPGLRPDPAREAALKQVVSLTTGIREDDHPAAAARDRRAWIAWVSFSDTEANTQIFARSFENEKWSELVQVSEKPGDYHKPAITIAADGAVWVAWPAQVNGNWDIYGRVLRSRPDRTGAKTAAWSPTERWTAAVGPDFAPQLASSSAGVLLVWQGARKGGLDILYRTQSNSGGWSVEGFVTDHAANDWEPAVAAGADGALHVAWDSYRAGDYDVFARTLRGGRWSTETAVAASERLETRPTLAVDGRNRLWLAWETGPEGWAADSADGGLRARRDIEIACIDNGRTLRAVEAEAALRSLAGERGIQAPSIAFGADDRLRLFFRKPINVNWLSVGAVEWSGAGWSEAETLLYSEGRVDQRIAVAELGRRLIAVYPAGSSRNTIYARGWEPRPRASDGTPGLTAAPQTARRAVPAPTSRHTLGGYQLVWGDLHRHTDISEDGGIIDGSLLDAMRYALDGAALDFIGVTDHTRYLPRRYNLWRIQQVTDLFYQPGRFSSMHAYERSQYSPWGHRNIVHVNRDYVPVPASYDIGDAGVSPWGLFAALRGKQAMSIPHTSAWSNKQVSWDYNDPDIERVVEIYQGLRSTYEYDGAPDPAGRAVYEKDSNNFVWNALERKLKLGFIASSDHRSTHMSYAAVYTRGIDRAAIFEALRARRTFAATDKILLDFSIGNRLMGEEVEVTGTPKLEIAILGTSEVSQVDIIKNNRIVYTSNPGRREVRFSFSDEEYRGGDAYYYVRVQQIDRNMAWASPIWVRQK